MIFTSNSISLKVKLGVYDAKKMKTAITPAEAPIIDGLCPLNTGKIL